MVWLGFAILGIIAGRLIRVFTPRFLRMRDTSLPFRWPWVEVAGAGLLLLLVYIHGAALQLALWYLFSLLLLAVAACDLHTKYIPIEVVFAGTALGLVNSAVFPDLVVSFAPQRALISLLDFVPETLWIQGLVLGVSGALIGFLLLEIIRRVFSQIAQIEVMGSGDALVLMMIGAFLGPVMVAYCLLPACLVGILGGVVTLLVYKQPHAPFGPSLAIGAIWTLAFPAAIPNGVAAFQNWLNNLPPSGLLAIFVVLILLLLGTLVRMRMKAAEYHRQIEEDYDQIDRKM